MSVEELFREGYTIIPSLISEDTCNKLKRYLDLKFNENLPYNYSEGHFQIHLPNDLDNFPEEIVFSNEIHNLLKDVFGKSYYMYSYTCNANLANEDQPYHMDCTHFHPIDTIKKFGSPGPPIQIVVNIYLQHTDEVNGSFEIVPKSHLFTDFEMDEDGRIDNKFIQNTTRCNLPKGSVIIRDKRTWHRGTRNTSEKVRYMVGFGYSLNWYKLGNLKFKKECESILCDTPFSIWNLDFID
tara:strand:+ start:3350 stop:4066 length:717 start_codon:yes stop_codon:yes gene_type:complete